MQEPASGGAPAASLVQKQTAGVTIREAKKLQRQQARQHRSQAGKERRQEQQQERELRKSRDRACEEANAIRTEALMSVEAMKVKAREEVRAAQEWMETQAQRRAEAEFELAKATAEAAAHDITVEA